MNGAPPQSPETDAALDGLRGFAALMVVASHASGMGLHLVPGLSLVGIGKYGVYLFFTLSAFLLTRQWLRLDASAWRTNWTWLNYAIRRVARIGPLYLTVILVGWALAPKGLGVALDGASVWRHLTMRDGLGIYWSVPVEVHYYLCLPLVAAWLALPIALALRIGALALVIGVASWVWPPAQAPENSANLGFYLPIFILGSIAAWISEAIGLKAGAAQGTQRLWRLGDWALALVIILSTPQLLRMWEPSWDYDLLHRWFVGWGLLWAITLVALQGGWLPYWQRMFAKPAMRQCGHWSFGLYLLHLPALALARHLPAPPIVNAWLGLALAILVAGFASRWIEQPCQRWARRIVGRD